MRMTPEEEEACKALGIDPNAPLTLDELNKKHRALALQYHPDQHMEKTPADRKPYEEKFKQIQAALRIFT